MGHIDRDMVHTPPCTMQLRGYMYTCKTNLGSLKNKEKDIKRKLT